MSVGILYIVATPIGNLEDISLRALRILKEVDFILAEDTRTTLKLLNHFGIKKEILSFHEHSTLRKLGFLLKLLKEGKIGALVSEAGTPGISDPGNKLVEKAALLGIKIVPVPGPSALTTALSISGFDTSRFVFLGFLPRKKKRKKFLEKIVTIKETIIFYESPYRIIKTLKELAEIFDSAKRQIMVSRELTKKFETIYRGFIQEVIFQIEKGPVKGEFTIIVEKAPNFNRGDKSGNSFKT